LEQKGRFEHDTIEIRIVAMLTRLVERFDPDEFQVGQNELNA
jgi:hypothetical protein